MNKGSILIVEDEKQLNQFLCEYMDNYFETIYSASDGNEALELYEKYKPDVIFTDIQIPYIDGLELAKKIRKYDTKTIIVILSAYSDKEKLFKAIELHLLTYLVKPIKSSDLKQLVLDIKNKISDQNIIQIDELTSYSFSTGQLLVNNTEIELTIYEKKFLDLLLKKRGICVSYEDISYHVYDLLNFSKDSISSLVKRLRKKIGNKIIVNCFNEGYKIV